MQPTLLTFFVLTFSFFPLRSFSINNINERTLKDNQPIYHPINNIKQSLLGAEVMNIDHEITSDNPLIIDFNTPHSLIIFKDSNNITVDIDFLSNTDSTDNEHQKITNKLITKDIAAFFFGKSIGKLTVKANFPNHFSAVKIVFPEACQQFYLQTKHDNFHVNKDSGKTELISSFSLTEESSMTCYYLDMDFIPYFVSFQFNDKDDFVKINGKITNSDSDKIVFTEKSILAFEDIYFSQNSLDLSKQQVMSMPKPQINMTISTHISNSDDSAISDIMNGIPYFKGYIQNTPGFIKGKVSENNTNLEYSNHIPNKGKQTTIIIVVIICLIIAIILCSAVSYCIKKRKYCKFNNIEDNDDEIDQRNPELAENDASSSVGADIDHTNDVFSNEGFQDKQYLQNEFDERYPQNNFQHSNIEYKVPSQSLLATVLDEENAKL